MQSKLNTINQVIQAGQHIVGDGQTRIATLQSELPSLEAGYIEATQTAKITSQQYEKCSKSCKLCT